MSIILGISILKQQWQLNHWISFHKMIKGLFVSGPMQCGQVLLWHNALWLCSRSWYGWNWHTVAHSTSFYLSKCLAFLFGFSLLSFLVPFPDFPRSSSSKMFKFRIVADAQVDECGSLEGEDESLNFARLDVGSSTATDDSAPITTSPILRSFVIPRFFLTSSPGLSTHDVGVFMGVFRYRYWW